MSKVDLEREGYVSIGLIDEFEFYLKLDEKLDKLVFLKVNRDGIVASKVPGVL